MNFQSVPVNSLSDINKSSRKSNYEKFCQKCLVKGHYTYECNKTPKYVARPSRTKRLENPKLNKFKRLRSPSTSIAKDILKSREKKRRLR
ncbi:hypothetical protein BCR36DRAFT_284459 [Piromyces finnis]|uniref:Uncharacterized protein n=1 Tax=Piromyces finnis TaxID=1754191 RepID=A0A1Y1VF83_9FUNG|nr:hypothetical protein BCR36DRAFT_284459 [Piromyces finnis]|eukprot:ORX53903.1 hypothetical protein BCR36DRAFT_284459 [Piromyces finnis]